MKRVDMLRIRQIAFAAADLATAEAELVDTLGLEFCYRDPQVAVFGLENALFPVGDQFFEIVSPMQPGTTAGRLIERRGGDTGYMVLFQVDDLAPVERRLDEHGVRVVFVAEVDDIKGIHLHPKDVPGAIVSVDAPRDPAEWPWAGPEWRDHIRRDVVGAIAGMTISTPDPDATCRIWSYVLGVEPTVLDGVRRIDLDGGVVDFAAAGADGREGITHIDVSSADRARVGTERELLGVTIRFV